MAMFDGSVEDCMRRALWRGDLTAKGGLDVERRGWARVSEMVDGRGIYLERVRVTVTRRWRSEAERDARQVAKDLMAMRFMGFALGRELCIAAVEEGSPVCLIDEGSLCTYAVDLLLTEVTRRDKE